LLNPIHFSTQGTSPVTNAPFYRHNATQQHSPQLQQLLQLPQPEPQYFTNSRPPVTTATAVVTSIFPARDAARVLILGCGNSRFGEDMRYDGWTGKMVNLDFSSVVCTRLRSLIDPCSPLRRIACMLNVFASSCR
jgi:hypothetical protein